MSKHLGKCMVCVIRPAACRISSMVNPHERHLKFESYVWCLSERMLTRRRTFAWNRLDRIAATCGCPRVGREERGTLWDGQPSMCYVLGAQDS